MRRLLALLVLPLLLVAACGGDDGGASGVGDISVQGSTSSAPDVQFEEGFSVENTQVKVLQQGDGPKVTPDDTVLVHYVGLNGRTGNQFESSWERGEPAEFGLGQGLIPGFEKALVGHRVGERVVVAIPPEDGYGAQGNPQIDARGTDTLVFVIDIQDLAATQAEGEAVRPPSTVPHLATDPQGVPTVFHETPQTAPAPDESEAYTVIKGEGAPIEAGQNVTLHYLGQVYPDGRVFDSSYGSSTVAFPIGQGQPLACFDELVGQTVGSRAILICPSAEGFGPQGNPQAGIKGTDTLIFAVDLLDAG